MQTIETLQEFENMLDSFYSNTNYYKTITKISESREKPPRPAVTNPNKIFCFDEISNIVDKTLKLGRHKSVDGLYFLKKRNTLDFIFIEFKNIHILRHDYDNLRKTINYEFRLKALESVFSVFPRLIDTQFNTNEAEQLKNFFYESKKHYYCVLNITGAHNNANIQSIINSDYFSVKRLIKYPFHSVQLFTPQTFNTIINTILTL